MVITYLNEGWQEGDGGELELWDALACKPEVQVAPLFGRTLIDLAGLAAVDTERDIVVQLGQAVDNLSDVAWHEKGVRLLPLVEWPAALRNFARGALVTLMGCLTWYILRWSAGPSALVYLIDPSGLPFQDAQAGRRSASGKKNRRFPRFSGWWMSGKTLRSMKA